MRPFLLITRPALAVTAVLGLILLVPPPQAAATVRPTYVAPVDAPVLDPFRPPTTPYGPGNRGIEYATVPGTPVRAAADGTVTFAGWVAGGLHVTVRHPDGIRTSYSFLAQIRVERGRRVRQGDLVGLAGGHLHVGARRGDTYLDPASLWGDGGPFRLELVPEDGGGATTAPAPWRRWAHFVRRPL